MQLTALSLHQRQYWAWQLLRKAESGSLESLASTLVDAEIELNPHQVEAALFACQNPLAKGVILADEVGLGKTIEAGLVIAQRWAERRRRILIIVPANLRKQWHQELLDKFGLEACILEAKSFNERRKAGLANPFEADAPIICSYPFAKSKADDIKRIGWDLVVLDEAHRLRNVYKPGNIIGRTLQDALAHVPAKVLLTATPLQNSLLELYGLVSFIDERVFGSLDSFRAQFGQIAKSENFEALRRRIAPLCQRTLRRDVQQYVPYTQRRALLETFEPGPEEAELARQVGEYLRRPNLLALSSSQRSLISMVLWKLLASSSHAIAGALETMAMRLEGVTSKPSSPGDSVELNSQPSLFQALGEDFDALAATGDEWPEGPLEENDDADAQLRQSVAAEAQELRQFVAMARQLKGNAKGEALLKGLARAFTQLEELGAAPKAIIFTESRQTQDYLLDLLSQTPFGERLVLFNGSNSDARAQAIYRNWLKKHAGSDRISGSKTADTRAALVEYFRDEGQIMIATEAGAEGINLQFCSLVINYDLPWNPQRIEQRIGRCHRYGQKHDVVVLNFLDVNNEADRRVHELLSEKFALFEGVFGASDEVLGAIGSGVDVERRIADIYNSCRTPEDIKASFEQLQLDLAGEINETMVRTRQQLMEHFDDEVHERVRVRASQGQQALKRHERLLMDVSLAELGSHARAKSDNSFELLSLPEGLELAAGDREVPLGRYELPRNSGDAHLYRMGHPLAQHLLGQAKQRQLGAARLRFDYALYGKQISTLLPLRGRSGLLQLRLLRVAALGQQEEQLVLAAVTEQGEALAQQDVEKLLRLPATEHSASLFALETAALRSEVERRQAELLREARQRQLQCFEQEVQKLDAWADDLKLGLEQRIKDIDREIKDVRRSASAAPLLEEKLHWQKRQKELEASRSKLRRELFLQQDDIEARRQQVIDDLEQTLQQRIEECTLFTVEWELV